MPKISASSRLGRVKRIFDLYQDRREFVRLDRNEDPVGWQLEQFEAWRRDLQPYDVAAYGDSTALATKLADWLKVPCDSLLVTAGSDAALKTIFETYVDPGDVVVMQNPSWRMYEVYNDIYQGQPLLINYERNLDFDWGNVLRALSEKRVRMVVLANPNQPTGTLLDASAVEQIVEAAFQRGTVVVMDEAYYLYTPRTAIALVAHYPNLIVVRTFSKAFGLAGLRLGYCIAQPERILELSLLRPVTDSNSLALKCGEYALDHMGWIAGRVEEVIAGRQYLYAQLVDAGIDAFPSHTNFLLVRCPSLDQARDLIAQAKQRRYLLKGPWTSAPLENCVRIGIGPLDLMKKFWADCAHIVTQYAARRES